MTNLAATFLMRVALRRGYRGVIINEHLLSKVQTRLHVGVLGRWFDFVRHEDLAERLRRPGRRPFCLLTFDDGKRSNFSEAAVELERLRVPAVFYLTTQFLTEGSLLWFDRRAQLIQALGRCPPELKLQQLKRLPLDRLLERLNQAGAARTQAKDEDSDDVKPMSWNEARDLHRRGFSIGAHGVTHAILTNEEPARARLEIEESLATVTAEVGMPRASFAFPNGNYTPELAAYARSCGASSIMTTEPMWLDAGASLWCLPRVQLFGAFSGARIEIKVALAAFKGAVTNPDGTGRAYRHPRPRLASQTPLPQAPTLQS